MSGPDRLDPEAFERRLGAFVAETTVDDLPAGAVDTVRRAFVDTVGVALAGAEATGGGIVADAVARDAGRPLDGLADASTTAAALALGTAAHALDYDDLSWGMDGHPSVVLVPPVLALAPRVDADGHEAVTAYAVGFEVACAVAEPISPDHYERGWHATSTFGTFGATATAASLLGLDAETCRRALSMAASMPAGTKRNFGSMTKPLHAGLAARSGVTAALLAAEGFTTGTETIGGERGFWSLYGDGAEAGPSLPRTDGWYIRTAGVHTKRYPCCYFTHSAIVAAGSIRDDAGLVPADVSGVRVRAARGAGDALTYPDPETSLEAKFSMQHAVAVALARETIGLDAFDPDTIHDPTVAELRERIDFAVDESLAYDSHAASVVVEADGRTYERAVDRPDWVHEDPPSAAELREKFLACAERRLDADEARETFATLSGLPDTSPVELLTRF
jgi:2-methylcitrate dehydratase PrpD